MLIKKRHDMHPNPTSEKHQKKLLSAKRYSEITEHEHSGSQKSMEKLNHAISLASGETSYLNNNLN